MIKTIFREIIFLALAVIITIAIINTSGITNKNLGSASNDAIYASKTLVQSNASTTSAVSIRGGAGILGSVVISSSTPYAISIYDGNATTTTAGGATLIATFPVSASAGTYTFDVAVRQGITVGGVAGFNGSYIVTYR
jgi:hypothetical protein